MVMLSQVLPVSITGIFPLIIQVLFNTITVWLSAYFVTEKAEIHNALIFSAISYFIVFFLRFLPIPYIPIINTIVIAEVVIKSLLAMKFFDTDFREGVCIAGVQMLFGIIISLPF